MRNLIHKAALEILFLFLVLYLYLFVVSILLCKSAKLDLMYIILNTVRFIVVSGQAELLVCNFVI